MHLYHLVQHLANCHTHHYSFNPLKCENWKRPSDQDLRKKSSVFNRWEPRSAHSSGARRSRWRDAVIIIEKVLNIRAGYRGFRCQFYNYSSHWSAAHSCHAGNNGVTTCHVTLEYVRKSARGSPCMVAKTNNQRVRVHGKLNQRFIIILNLGY